MKAGLFAVAALALIAAVLAEAPYPPSGWRPAKAFLLPVRAAKQEYGPPPRPVYGPPPSTTAEPEPEAETTTVAEEVTTEEATTTEAVTESATEETPEGSENAVESGRADEQSIAEPTGLYYVLLPDGRLQRVLYTAGTPELGYNAQLRIADVEPVPPAPVYAYAGPLTRILRK